MTLELLYDAPDRDRAVACSGRLRAVGWNSRQAPERSWQATAIAAVAAASGK
ncbi:MAG: hypothetical protein M0T77_07965 [Actinomycetota bacterium]|nr:hypothetical protein [Actinomycetota bacterium]